ncbi:septal ring lytic transglycosylase RlpA family protein [Aurantiacibacter aquimixticola]|nr:septal ring lytic transglycosylase RlpA family protein [Aurantiacibacter aquimixticola]
MDGNSTKRLTPRAVAVLAAIALLGSTGAGYAEQSQERVDLAAETTATEAAPAGPVFTPSDEAEFAEAFNAFDEPVEPAIPDHAVDITTIEPAAPPLSTSLGSGIASYYGRRFHGRRTANGERFDMNAMTAAHKTLPFGTRVRVTNPRSGQSVVVRINDRGPFTPGRTIDLSRAAATEIGLIRRGHGNVELELLD